MTGAESKSFVYYEQRNATSLLQPFRSHFAVGAAGEDARRTAAGTAALQNRSNYGLATTLGDMFGA